MKTYPIDPMVSVMARFIRDDEVVTTGVASDLPMLAVALARATHATEATYFNCVGAVNPRWKKLPFSSVAPELLPGEAFIGLEEIWEMANRGRIGLMFFGAFQIDSQGRTNLHRLQSGRKLPGIAGGSTMRRKVKRAILFTTRHNKKTFVPEVDSVTTSPKRGSETRVVTPLAILNLNAKGPRIESLLPGHDVQEVLLKTGFDLDWSDSVETLPAPNREEREALERLDPEGRRARFL